MPVGGSKTSVVEPGELTLRLEQSVVPMSVSHVAECPDLGPACFEHPEHVVPYNHHVDQTIAETALSASLGLTSFLAVETRWSLRIADVNPTYSELDGTPKAVPNDIHHHDETLVDVTDPWLVAQLVSATNGLVGSLRLGASFPLGRTEPDPYALGRQGKSHEHLQAGTGTVVPIAGVGVAYTIAPGSQVPVTLGLGGVGFFNAYENDEGFRAPVRVYASHRVSVGFMGGKLSPFGEATIAHEGEELWNGEIGLEGSNVRTEIYLGAGLEWVFLDPWAVELTTRARVATLTDAPAFKSYGLFSLALSTHFDLWGAPEAEGRPVIEKRGNGVVEFEK